MNHKFKGWKEVRRLLEDWSRKPQPIVDDKPWLNEGQLAGVEAMAKRLPDHGLVVADEVGMGKTRIAVEAAKAVTRAKGRVAILIPPGLGYQWQEELRKRGVDAPPILRSLWGYLGAWSSEEPQDNQPWFGKQVVLISHGLTNWRFSEKSPAWRWSLLPALYAYWRKQTGTGFPRKYWKEEIHNYFYYKPALYAARSISQAISLDGSPPALKQIENIYQYINKKTPWPGVMKVQEGLYMKGGDLREPFEQTVGLGLGVFDLVIIDEAHKSRGSDSMLSHLLDPVILQSGRARRLGLTATPVELHIDQWKSTLGRIGIDETELEKVRKVVNEYDKAVKRVRKTWKSSREDRDEYKKAAAVFQKTLSPYLLRRDKREECEVRLFQEITGEAFEDYRREKEITISTKGLTPEWKKAVCAAESLSLVSSMAQDSMAKRLRLNLANGHGLSTFLDQTRQQEKLDLEQIREDEAEQGRKADSGQDLDPKQRARLDWWRGTIKQAFLGGKADLFGHPALLAAVEAIEEYTTRGEKVLVFGRFTRPLQALVRLLNAREMLRCLDSGTPWPESGIRKDWPGEREAGYGHDQAVRAALAESDLKWDQDQVNVRLEKQYKRLENSRRQFRKDLLENLGKGLNDHSFDTAGRLRSIFEAFKKAIREERSQAKGESNSLALVGRALEEFGTIGAGPSNKDDTALAQDFQELLEAVTDKDEWSDNNDNNKNGQREPEEYDSGKLWSAILERLKEEYGEVRGRFARLMYGGTSHPARRLIQAGFNRAQGQPRVLVAQSLVGREGLNLHRACRVVVLLHPEWNPGVVEQQIGRVDRVGSRWCQALDKAIEEGITSDGLPRIEIHPVIFEGTYDEYNWEVLKTRWADYRAQLHGIVIPHRLAEGEKDKRKIQELSEAAPNFSPSRSTSRSGGPKETDLDCKCGSTS